MTTGNPVRKEITEILNPSWRYQERARAEMPLQILIVGGSLGAHIKSNCSRSIETIACADAGISSMCGQDHKDATQARYADVQTTLQVEVQPFIEDMAKAYANADLIICRAGALTVTEIATAGVAAIFVPLPSAVDDHQTAMPNF